MSARSANLGLFILRAVVAVVFAAHGAQKLFVQHLPAVAQSMAHLGVPVPPAAAVVVTLVEFVGGILMLLGLFVRAVGALIAFEMLVAMLLVHLPRGFFNTHPGTPGGPGIEFPLVLLCVNLALVFLGAGAWSMDGWVASDREASGGQPAPTSK